MPLSARERVERQVLRHLIFHARSPVILRADEETAKTFECSSAEDLAGRLADMHESDLFRVLPGRGENGDLLGPPAAPSDRERRAERKGRIERAFFSGLTVMVTSEGIQHFDRLRKKTTELRLAEWRKESRPADSGSWTRG